MVDQVRSPVVEVVPGKTVPAGRLDDVERRTVGDGKRHGCATIALAMQGFDLAAWLPVEVHRTLAKRFVQVRTRKPRAVTRTMSPGFTSRGCAGGTANVSAGICSGSIGITSMHRPPSTVG
ncbi:hypothetical protein SDC9_186397 [bioreactor metagenome]|uniref:Uncharacterized protein n=1 Tax=bioreactor metagenome TaxID=1076179 RepID=A0A645HKF1_9ZZZZ